MNNQEHELIALRNYRKELQRCFNSLDELAKRSFGEQKEKYEADAESLRAISRAGSLTNIKKAIANFKEQQANDEPVITSHAYDLQLQARLTKAHKEHRR